MKKIIISSIILNLIFASLTFTKMNAQCRLDKSDYKLVFDDNMNYTNITDLKKVWQVLPYNHPNSRYFGWGGVNGEYYDESQITFPGNGIVRLNAKHLVPPVVHTIIKPGNILETRNNTFVSGMIRTREDITYDPINPNVPNWDPAMSGYRYGMFEIRCKLPATHPKDNLQFTCFPAFWLHSAQSEIDVFEYDGSNGGNFFYSSNHYDYGNQQLHCGNFFTRHLNNKLTDDFHTFTVVWTPEKVTFFFDNREYLTRDASLIPTVDQINFLVANLAMPETATEDTYMDIDYIKVYKPINNDYNLPYKSSSDYMNTSIFNNSNSLKVSDKQGAITSNSNGDMIFHLNSIDNRIYVSEQINGIFNTSIINYNYTPTLPAEACNGDLKFNTQFNKLLYKGFDNRIQFFELYPNNVWMHWFIDDDFNTTVNNISSSPGAMDLTNDGKIAYRGIDDKIHIFKWNSNISKWDQLNINYTYGNCAGMADADFVQGDVIVEQSTNNIIYRGRDGRLQCFYQSSPFVYHHAWIDPNWNQFVNANPGSIISTPNGIFYRGTDDKLHRFYWDGTNNIHQVASYAYGACSGMPDADFVNGGLSYYPQSNFILYTGRDGRIQRFEIPAINTSNSWNHYWIDDYWNTFDYISFGSNTPNKFSSTFTSSDGKIIYNNGILGSGLSYFKMELCERLNPICNSQFTLNKKANPSQLSSQEKLKIEIYPNPVTSELIIKNIGLNKLKYEVLSIENKTVISNIIDANSNKINLSSLNSGLYFLKTIDGDNVQITKFEKK